MFLRLCAVALAAAPIHQIAQTYEVRPEPQGLWSQAVRDRTLLIEGAPDEARELGSRALAELPPGAQSALRLMRLRQTDLRTRVRDRVRELGAEAEFEARARTLNEAVRADGRRAPAGADRRLAEADVDLEERATLEAEKNLVAARGRLERARVDLRAREHSPLCGMVRAICDMLTLPARQRHEASESEVLEMVQRSEDAAARLNRARANRDAVHRELSTSAERFTQSARALEGFYRTAPSPGCARRLAFHQGPGVGLRESPFLSGSISEEDIARDRARLFACVDDRQILTGVEVTDDQGRRLAKSEISRDRAGAVNRVRIFDRASTLVEDHRYSPTAPEYEVTFRGARGGWVRAATK